jgi:DNA-binding response OmpR family regulator
LRTVLIVDTDLGFVFWLGKILSEAGYQSIPATNVSDALTMIATLELQPDLSVLNPSVPGADLFIERQRPSKRKIVAIGDAETSNIAVDGYKRKPSRADEQAKSDWLDFITGVLENQLPHRPSQT